MLYYHANIFSPGGYVPGGFRVENGIFTEIIPGLSDGDVDLQGMKVIPGLVDIHIHGCSGSDFSDGAPDALRTMAVYLAKNGITSFAPTSVTLPLETLAASLQTAQELYRHRPPSCARMIGIRMEGPFLSKAKKGAQNEAYLRTPDFEVFRNLYDSCGGLIRLVDLAPELPGATEFTEKVFGFCTVSIGHSDADYRDAAAIFDIGARHVTHLFNAMSPFHHRSPGIIGAASERESVTAELICDGLHVHPSAVRMAFRLFPGRLCLVSDSLRCCGMPDGIYDLGGQNVTLRDGLACLADGTIAGAAANLFAGLQNAVRFGIPELEAVRAATLLPAQIIGSAAEIGSIEAGRLADFVVCDSRLQLQAVYLGGERIS